MHAQGFNLVDNEVMAGQAGWVRERNTLSFLRLSPRPHGADCVVLSVRPFVR